MIASRPARAMRGAAVLVMVAIAWRIPAMRREFAAALTAGDGRIAPAGARLAVAMPPTAPPVAATKTSGQARNRRRASNALREPDPASPNRHPRAGVNPSRDDRGKTGSRFRTDDGTNAGSDLNALAALAARLAAPPPPIAAAASAAPRYPTAVAPTPPAPPGSLASAALRAPAAYDLATAAYARLAAGDRRGAARLFDAALALGDPRDAAWRGQRDALTRHWGASAYSIIRARGAAEASVTPVLGGGQSGGGLTFTLDPLARRPVALTVRGSLAHDDSGRTAFAAVGVQWRPVPGVTLAAERLIGVGPAARDDWTARVAVGEDRRLGRLRTVAYAEGGIVGRAGYAAAQARIGPEVDDRGVAVVPGVGVWTSVQRDGGRTIARVDLGPGVAARAGPLAVAIDYRLRVAGNAAPGSGPVVTLSAAF